MPSLLTSEFGKNLRRLIDSHAGQPRPASLFDRRIKPVPGCNGDVLRGRNGTGKLRRFKIEMAMIESGEDLLLHHIFETLQIDDKAGHGVRLAGDRHLKRVVVAVAVAVGAAPEDLLVLLRGPIRVPVVVLGREGGPARQEDHLDASLKEMLQAGQPLHPIGF